MAQAAATSRRTAQIHVDPKDPKRTVRVSHPGQLTPDEIRRIDERLINDVVKKLTGCACLSGTIDVIWEKNFEQVLEVDLRT